MAEYPCPHRIETQVDYFKDTVVFTAMSDQKK